MQLPGYAFYGGATVTRTFDAAGIEYVGCCAHRLDGSTKVDFGFYIFKRAGTGAWERVPLQRFCTGRGSISSAGLWIAVSGSEFFTDSIPGFVPFEPAAGRAAIPIPAGSPIAALYAGTYKPSDLDTPEEVALRVSKQLAAIHQLVDLLVSADVLSRE